MELAVISTAFSMAKVVSFCHRAGVIWSDHSMETVSVSPGPTHSLGLGQVTPLLSQGMHRSSLSSITR
jgi:hypothetical protein